MMMTLMQNTLNNKHLMTVLVLPKIKIHSLENQYKEVIQIALTIERWHKNRWKKTRMNKKKMINQCQEEAEEANKLIVEDKDQEEKILQDFTAVLNQLLLDHHHKNSIRMTYNNSNKSF